MKHRITMNRPFANGRTSSGFTLIELLVVIAIIAMLASIILASLSSSRVKARDAARVSEMIEFQKALEVYYSVNGHYPYTCSVGGTWWASFAPSQFSSDLLCTTPGGIVNDGKTLSQEMTQYIAPFQDPNGGTAWSQTYLYYNTSDGNSYCYINFAVEKLNDVPASMIDGDYCQSVANGQCTAGGISGGPLNAIFMGSGVYATKCPN